MHFGIKAGDIVKTKVSPCKDMFGIVIGVEKPMVEVLICSSNTFISFGYNNKDLMKANIKKVSSPFRERIEEKIKIMEQEQVEKGI